MGAPAPGGGYGSRNFVTWNGRWEVTIMDKSHTEKFREQLDDGC
jgi:hypothetical protein